MEMTTLWNIGLVNSMIMDMLLLFLCDVSSWVRSDAVWKSGIADIKVSVSP